MDFSMELREFSIHISPPLSIFRKVGNFVSVEAFKELFYDFKKFNSQVDEGFDTVLENFLGKVTIFGGFLMKGQGEEEILWKEILKSLLNVIIGPIRFSLCHY